MRAWFMHRRTIIFLPRGDQVKFMLWFLGLQCKFSDPMSVGWKKISPRELIGTWLFNTHQLVWTSFYCSDQITLCFCDFWIFFNFQRRLIFYFFIFKQFGTIQTNFHTYLKYFYKFSSYMKLKFNKGWKYIQLSQSKTEKNK